MQSNAPTWPMGALALSSAPSFVLNGQRSTANGQPSQRSTANGQPPTAKFEIGPKIMVNQGKFRFSGGLGGLDRPNRSPNRRPTNGTCVRLASWRSARRQPHSLAAVYVLARPLADLRRSEGRGGGGRVSGLTEPRPQVPKASGEAQSDTAAVSLWASEPPCGVGKRPPPPKCLRHARYDSTPTSNSPHHARRCTQARLAAGLPAQTPPVRLVRSATEQQPRGTPGRARRDIAGTTPTRAHKAPVACWLVLPRAPPARLVRRATEQQSHAEAPHSTMEDPRLKRERATGPRMSI